jgi:catechol 2,3-dioxygenase-like lactoylglutathione lyase family enzyme
VNPALIAVHPVLGSGDVEASVQFYVALGFHEIFRDQRERPTYAAVRRDAVELHLQWNDAVLAPGVDRPVYRLLVRGVDALFAELTASGALTRVAGSGSPWAVPGNTPWGTREFHVRDPFGNGLQFYSEQSSAEKR